jgi:hypothetical protein
VTFTCLSTKHTTALRDLTVLGREELNFDFLLKDMEIGIPTQ